MLAYNISQGQDDSVWSRCNETFCCSPCGCALNGEEVHVSILHDICAYDIIRKIIFAHFKTCVYLLLSVSCKIILIIIEIVYDLRALSLRKSDQDRF